MKITQLSGAIIALGSLAASVNAATTLISGSSTENTLNGDFTATAGWIATGDLTPAQFQTNNNDTISGSSAGQNAVLGVNTAGDIRTLGIDTGHILAVGDVFTLNFDWLDASPGWENETITAQLFYTVDNTISGARTEITSFTTVGEASDVTWESSGVFTSGAAAAEGDGARTVFLDFIPNADGNSFARIDDVNLSVEPLVVPEPSSTALLGLGGLALILRRRK